MSDSCLLSSKIVEGTNLFETSNIKHSNFPGWIRPYFVLLPNAIVLLVKSLAFVENVAIVSN